MSNLGIAICSLMFYIPTAYSLAFRAFGLGYVTKGRLLLGFGVYSAYMAAVPALLIVGMGSEVFALLSGPMMLLGSFSVLIFTTDPPDKTIFLQLVQSSMVTVISVLLNMAYVVFGVPYPMLFALLIMACTIVYVVALRVWAKPLRFIADHIHDDRLSMMVLPVIKLVVVSLIPVYPPKNFSEHPIFYTGMMLVAELSFLLYIYILYRNLIKISMLSRQELKNELLQAEASYYRTFLERAKQNRHDLRHHDALILEHLEAGDIVGAKQYLLAHNKELEETSLRQFCHNITANAVLRLYERRAQEEGISFFSAADIPRELPLASPELGGLLGNLLENAMNACRQSTDVKTYIVFTSRVEDKNLLLELRNAAPTDTTFQNAIPVSKKAGGGIGTRSIIAVVKKHNGIVDFSQHDTEFIVRIIIPI